MTALADDIRHYIVAEFLDGEEAADLTNDFDLVANGVVDSLGLVRVISHISQAYSIPVDDIPMKPESFRSIEAICSVVENAKAASV